MTTEPLPFVLVLAGSASQADPALMPAACWMAGIMFLALAVDASGKRAALLALTGLALLPLAWFSASVPGAAIGAALVSGAWLLAPLLNRWRRFRHLSTKRVCEAAN